MYSFVQVYLFEVMANRVCLTLMDLDFKFYTELSKSKSDRVPKGLNVCSLLYEISIPFSNIGFEDSCCAFRRNPYNEGLRIAASSPPLPCTVVYPLCTMMKQIFVYSRNVHGRIFRLLLYIQIGNIMRSR